MKKRIVLPLTLLMAFSAKASDPVAAEVVAPADSAEVLVAPAAPVAEPAHVAEPVVIAAAHVAEPAPAPAPALVIAPAAPAAHSALPCEDDINNVLALLSAYTKQSSVIKNLHDLASNDDNAVIPVNEATVRSLLNLLELHKKEADLIANLRASLAAIQSALGAWDGDVAHLVGSKARPAGKQKPAAKRDLDMEAVKNEASKPRPTK